VPKIANRFAKPASEFPRHKIDTSWIALSKFPSCVRVFGTVLMAFRGGGCGQFLFSAGRKLRTWPVARRVICCPQKTVECSNEAIAITAVAKREAAACGLRSDPSLRSAEIGDP
jgi:hypothetical protein